MSSQLLLKKSKSDVLLFQVQEVLFVDQKCNCSSVSSDDIDDVMECDGIVQRDANLVGCFSCCTTAGGQNNYFG